MQTLPAEKQAAIYYLVADRLLSADLLFEPLSAHQVEVAAPQDVVQGGVPEGQSFIFPLPDQLSAATTIYCGPGWLGGQWREVSIHHTDRGYWLNVVDGGDFYVAEDGSVICFQWLQIQNQAWALEAVLGPALILALALQGTFCLHASAVALNGQVIIFVGESGWGKSTLAAYLQHEVDGDWQFVADDVLPICIDESDVVCLPHFPQLKLPAEQQWRVEQPRKLPVTAVFLINNPDQLNDSVGIQPLTTRDAILTIVRHTVAAKLFDDQLLTKHLAFATHFAERVPIKQLIYPRVYKELPVVSNALFAAMAPLEIQHIKGM